MSAVASSLLRRGMEVANSPDGPKLPQNIQLSTWGVIVVAITGFAFVLAGAAVSRLPPA